MLKLGHSKSFWYPVKVKILDENGNEVTYEFKAKFRRMTSEAVNKVQFKKDLELLRENLLGWDGIVDESDQPIPFTEKNKEHVLNLWPVPPALAKAFMEAHSPEGRVKN
jgi:hypothetical protein